MAQVTFHSNGFGLSVLLSLVIAGSGICARADQQSDMHFQRALDYQFKNNIDSAILEYRLGLSIDPDSVTARDNLGTLLLDDKGDIDGAISEFVTALGIDAHCSFCQTHLNDAVALRNSTAEEQLNRGNSLYRGGDLYRAAAAFRVACYLDPQSGEAHNSLSWTTYRLGDLKEALKEVNLALQLKPEDPEYINSLACILYDQGDLKGAMAQFQRAISRSSKANPADLYGLAIVLLSTGDKEKAVDDFKEALKSDPNFVDVKYLRDRIGMSVHALSDHDTLLNLSGIKSSDQPQVPDNN